MSYSGLGEIVLQVNQWLVMFPGIAYIALEQEAPQRQLGIEDRLFQCHGRWKSDSAKDGICLRLCGEKIECI